MVNALATAAVLARLRCWAARSESLSWPASGSLDRVVQEYQEVLEQSGLRGPSRVPFG